jgi:cysteinyl-tRNA synthetase
MFHFQNTLSGRQEDFQPLIPGEVRIYTCGPTVYGTPHIGNYRAYVFEDLLKRALRFGGFRVLHVMNITDVDDKTIREARAAGLGLNEYTAPFIKQFKDGLNVLRVDPADHYPRATEHIPEMTAIIRGLLDKGAAYRKDGSIYFNIARWPDYGKLSGMNPDDLRTTARIGVRLESDEYEKDNAQDFALWKAPKEGEPFWETDIGPGRPGWHIECSAMSSKYLGPTFDIHCGGVDNIFPHHENEIAQSEAYFGKPFVRYWLHCHHLIVDGEKMSKSKGNFFTLPDLADRGVDFAVLRYFLISTHYRRVLNFTFEALEQAAAALKRIKDFLHELTSGMFPPGRTDPAAAVLEEAQRRFLQGLEDDLNISAALTGPFELIRKVHTLIKEGLLRADDAASFLDFFRTLDAVLAVLPPRRREEAPNGLLEKIAEREKARRAGNFPTADAIRDELLRSGIVLEDTKDGIRWKIVKTGADS